MRILLILLSALALLLAGCAPEKPTHSIGLNFEQFVANLNARNTKFVIRDATTNQAADGLLSFVYSFNKNITLRADIYEKTRMIQSLSMALAPSSADGLEKFQETLDIPTSVSVVMQAVNPTVDIHEIGKAAMELCGKSASQPDRMHTYLLNGNKYAMQFSSKDGVYLLYVLPDAIAGK